MSNARDYLESIIFLANSMYDCSDEQLSEIGSDLAKIDDDLSDLEFYLSD